MLQGKAWKLVVLGGATALGVAALSAGAPLAGISGQVHTAQHPEGLGPPGFGPELAGISAPGVQWGAVPANEPTGVAVITTTTLAAMSVSGVDVVLRPGDSLQAAVDAHGAGTVFLLKAGTYRRQQVRPKSGDEFVGEKGAVLTGEGVSTYAFGGSASDVVIRGLVVEHYATPLQSGVIRTDGGARDWVIEGNEIRSNGGMGVYAGSGWKIVGNYVHHNQQLGLAGAGSGILVQGNEIAFNNPDGSVDASWAAGGTKFVHTTNLVVRDNYSHDNRGPGLWTDAHNVNTLYEGNRLVNNTHAGIKHEVSCAAVIRNNYAAGNGFRVNYKLEGAGIVVMNSPNVEIYGNTVKNNKHGIGGINSPRTGPADPCPLQLKNLYVHDNTIIMSTGFTGVVASTSDPVFTSWNNRFRHNTYQLGANTAYYQWMGDRTTAQWKSYGQDTTGTWK